MARPKTNHPTPAELEVLQLLWEQGPLTVREVMDLLNQSRTRAYTSVMSLLNVMTDKKLLERREAGRAFTYHPRVKREAALGQIVSDVLGRAFDGSASALVLQVLEASQPNPEELDLIRQAIREYEQQESEEGPAHSKGTPRSR